MPTKTSDNTPQENREAQALAIVRNYAFGTAAASLVPFLQPLVLIGVQLTMARRLAGLYEIDFIENAAKSVITSLLGLGTASAVGGMVTRAAPSLASSAPGISALAGPALGGASTYAVGKVLIQHFESGGTFLTLDPDKVRDFYQEDSKPQDNVAQRPPRP